MDFAPPTAAPEMGSSGYGSSSGPHLDPERVFALIITRRPEDLFEYLDSVPGAREDLQCRLARLFAIAGNPFYYPSEPELEDAAILNQSSASSSSTPAAMVPPQQTSYNAVIDFPTIPGRTLDRTSAINSERHASDFAPWGTDSTLELAFAELSMRQQGSEQTAPCELNSNDVSPQELEQNSYGTPGEVLSTVDVKGKRPASEEKMRVQVASLIAEDGTRGAAGLLIINGTWQAKCTSCLPMRVTEPVLFAAACCEGIKIARAYQPITVVLESHLFHLLNLLADAHPPYPEMEELMELLERCTVEAITKESNGAALGLAARCLMEGRAELFFRASY